MIHADGSRGVNASGANQMMPVVVYYVACSLDGYIATADGGVDWLEPFQAGVPTFATASGQDSLRLVEVKTYPNGLVQLNYEPAAETGAPGSA